jgi:hypothetical protein
VTTHENVDSGAGQCLSTISVPERTSGALFRCELNEDHDGEHWTAASAWDFPPVEQALPMQAVVTWR